MGLRQLKSIHGAAKIAFVLLILFFNKTYADVDVSSEILVQWTTSWDGSAYSYPSGIPQITIQKINIKTDDGSLTLPLHCHPMPIAAVVISGAVQVVKKSGQSKQFSAGDAFIEVSEAWHRGVVTEDTKLLVFYAGAVGEPLMIGQNDPLENTPACSP